MLLRCIVSVTIYISHCHVVCFGRELANTNEGYGLSFSSGCVRHGEDVPVTKGKGNQVGGKIVFGA